MFKYLGLGLMGIFAMMVVPGSFDTQANEFAFFGAGHMVVKDAYGNITLEQTIHNRIVNSGEDYLIDQIFQDGAVDIADDASIGVVCISDDNTGGGGTSITTPDEADNVTTFDAADTYVSGLPCQEVLQDGVTTTGGVATFGTLTFSAATHLPNGDIVKLVGICQADGDGIYNENLTSCLAGNAGAGILFAIFNPTDVQLNASETVDITYSFDISEDAV